jgi:GcrA cell cycle regulator
VHRLGLSNRAGGAPAPAPAAKSVAKDKPAKQPAAKARPAKKAEAKDEPVAEKPAEKPAAAAPARKQIIPAGQPLPPQPSANEISPEALETVREVEKTAKKLTLMELTERTCKWPIGDPATEDFWFCGLPVQPGKPYCEAHVGVAFQPMSARRDRKR